MIEYVISDADGNPAVKIVDRKYADFVADIPKNISKEDLKYIKVENGEVSVDQNKKTSDIVAKANQLAKDQVLKEAREKAKSELLKLDIDKSDLEQLKNAVKNIINYMNIKGEK